MSSSKSTVTDPLHPTACSHFKPTDPINRILSRNKEWANSTHADLIPSLSRAQAPSILWFGCSDSRVPETTILGLNPGEVFTHRNIANVLPYGDLSSLSVLQYAVEVIQVRHVVVCGHYGCGGVNAALAQSKLGLIDAWLKPIREVRAAHREELAALRPEERARRLVELNCIASVQSVNRNANVQEAKRTRQLEVHGLIYDVATGLVNLLDVPADPFEDEFSYD